LNNKDTHHHHYHHHRRLLLSFNEIKVHENFLCTREKIFYENEMCESVLRHEKWDEIEEKEGKKGNRKIISVRWWKLYFNLVNLHRKNSVWTGNFFPSRVVFWVMLKKIILTRKWWKCCKFLYKFNYWGSEGNNTRDNILVNFWIIMETGVHLLRI